MKLAKAQIQNYSFDKIYGYFSSTAMVLALQLPFIQIIPFKKEIGQMEQAD